MTVEKQTCDVTCSVTPFPTTTTMLARLAAVRRVPRLLAVPVRYSSNEGSVAQSKEFG